MSLNETCSPINALCVSQDKARNVIGWEFIKTEGRTQLTRKQTPPSDEEMWLKALEKNQ